MANILDNTTNLQNLLNKVNNLPNAGSDITLPELTNPASTSDILSGKEAIDKDGNIIEGTISTKTSSNLTASGNTVTVPAGYYATQATKSVATATQATPTISVDANGKITATATQTAGYVAAGSKSATKQLAFQSAKTITPTKSSQVAVSSGYYTGGAITVAAIPDTYIQPSGTLSITENGTHNVKNYASVNVSVAGGTGGNTDIEDLLVTRTVTTYENSRVTTIGNFAFYYCKSLTTVNFPKCTTIGSNAFNGCSSLTTVSFPECTTIGSNAFNDCISLKSANFPVCTTISNNTFYGCTSLTTVSFPVCTTISNNAFRDCKSLTTANFPKCTNMGNFAFDYCSSLTTANFPKCTNIGVYAFAYCSSLTTVSFPECTTIGSNAFNDCISLKSANFPVCTSIESTVFAKCYNLSSLTLGASTVCTLANSNAFSSTPYAGYKSYFSGTPYIYVPSSLLASYKSATNWTYFSSYFSAIKVQDGGSFGGGSGD